MLERAGLLFLLTALTLAGCAEPRPDSEVDHLSSLDAAWVTEGRLDLGQDDDDRWIGRGWHVEEPVARWTSEREATLTLPLREGGPGRVRMRVMGRQPDPEPTRLTLVINDFVLPTRELGYPLTELTVEVPTGVLRAGHNEITLACDELDRSHGRPLGIYLDWIELEVEPFSEAAEPEADELTAGHWLEDRSGLLAGGRLELALEADGSGRLELYSIDEHGRVRELLQQIPLAAGPDTVTLAPPAGLDPATACLLRFDPATEGGGARLLHAIRRAASRDDILLLMIDTLRADHLGSYGHPTAETPNLDRLAARGLRFENAVAHSAITGPSHASFFLSRPPSQTGIVNNFEGELDRTAPTLAELLRAANYENHAAISISPIRSKEGFARGFASYDEDLGVAFLRDGKKTVARAEALIARGAADDPRPRFTFVHLAEPHEPYDAHGTVELDAEILVDGELVRRVPVADVEPEILELEVEPGERRIEIRCPRPVRLRRLGPIWPDSTESRLDVPPSKKGRRRWELTLRSEAAGTLRLACFLSEGDLGIERIQRRYVLEVEAVDRLVGRLLDALEKSGRADRTWVVFTADHGEALGEKGHVGHVQHLYEPFVRIPLIVRAPSGGGGRVRADVAGGIDLLPTLLDAVGLPVPADAAGRSLLDPGPDDRRILLETHAPQATHTKYALRGRSAKIVWTPETDAYELYDLEQDPAERQDLYSQDGPRSQQWQTELDRRVRALLADAERSQLALDPETQAALRSLGYIE